jgi:hypothetical protein
MTGERVYNVHRLRVVLILVHIGEWIFSTCESFGDIRSIAFESANDAFS